MRIVPEAYPAATRAATRSGDLIRLLPIGRRERTRRRGPHETLFEQPRGPTEWGDQFAPDRVRVLTIRFDSEFKLFGLPRGNIQGAEYPVPHRQTASQIFVEVGRITR